uniref:Ubiquitin-like domain-containing protein n=1 Tax=Angiostrongylus cantonensis TaxID=6313 RepID=A0A158P931_ANGCA
MSDVEDEAVPTISLKVKTTTAVYDVEVKANATISDVKDVLVSKLSNVEKSLLCLIFSGKILKDHEKLETHIAYSNLLIEASRIAWNMSTVFKVHIADIGDGMALHLVVRQGQNRVSSGSHGTGSLFGANLPAGGPQAMAQQMMNNPEMMRQMMDNPLMQNIMGNPEIFRSLLASNPQIQQLIERNPELGHVLNDPDMMRQTMEMIRNPNMFQEMMRNHDLAIRNLQGIPGGEAALQRLYQDVQEPLLNSATSSLAGNPFASLRRGEDTTESRSQRAGQENSEALPNPWGGGQSSSQNTQASNGVTANASEDGIASLLGSSGMNSLMEQMMSDPALMQSLMRPEILGLFRQSISQNPQIVQQIMEQNPLIANNPQLAEQLRAQLPNMVNLMGNPEVMAAVSNPRVLEALRMMQQGMDTLRREAPALAGIFGTGFGPAPSTTQANSSVNSQDSIGMLNNMFAGMNATTVRRLDRFRYAG